VGEQMRIVGGKDVPGDTRRLEDPLIPSPGNVDIFVKNYDYLDLMIEVR